MNDLKRTWNRAPAWFTWMIYAAIGVFVLTVVQSLTDTERLTSATTSSAMLRWAVPIMLAGLGGLFSERAGVVNIGLEGMLVLGMWFGAWGTINYGPWWGLVIGILGGGLGALVHAIATVSFGVDHIISGVAIIIAAPGITRFLSSEIFANYDGGSITQSPGVDGVGKFTFPFLSGGNIGGWTSPDILGWFIDKGWWFVGDLASVARGLTFNLSQMTVLAYLLVPLSAWVLWRTRFGLRLRIAGENPLAGESQGINIIRYKYIGVLLSGALAGFGGAFISSPELNGIYLEGSTLQRGFIGLAALIIGNWRPTGVMAAALLFGYPTALGKRDLEGTATHSLLLVAVIALAFIVLWALSRHKTSDAILAGVLALLAGLWFLSADTVPKWWTDIQPQVFVILVLVFFAQRLRMPMAVGQPYRKGET
ncbi:MAG: ABC transporter permease [Acidimicrobiaceae bacterium]|jgi:general nucleoside transport system permease protein|nr:ABC transporter permease [Acidimicrobiaceae bacterium]MBT5851154.1 ABC transporter permease [Acidimicrobiaceae bacterium]